MLIEILLKGHWEFLVRVLTFMQDTNNIYFLFKNKLFLNK